MSKFIVQLTADKETILVTYGEPVEDAPSVALDLRGRTLEAAIDAAKTDIENTGPLLFMLHGGPYAPELAGQYGPEKVAEFNVEVDGLDEALSALA